MMTGTNGKILVRTSAQLHRECKLAASRANMSLNQWCIQALMATLSDESVRSVLEEIDGQKDEHGR